MGPLIMIMKMIWGLCVVNIYSDKEQISVILFIYQYLFYAYRDHRAIFPHLLPMPCANWMPSNNLL